MHEQVIAQDIIRAASAQGKVSRIVVEVGDLGHLPLEEMESVLKAMTPWEVIMVAKKAKVRCKCSYVGEPKILEKGHDYNVFSCPHCGQKMPEVLEGKDIVLKSVVVE